MNKFSFFSGKVFLYNLERALPTGLFSYRPNYENVIFFFRGEIKSKVIKLARLYISTEDEAELDLYYEQLEQLGVVVCVTGLKIDLFDDGSYMIEGYTPKQTKEKL